jgi:hypothetical protein
VHFHVFFPLDTQRERERESIIRILKLILKTIENLNLKSSDNLEKGLKKIRKSDIEKAIKNYPKDIERISRILNEKNLEKCAALWIRYSEERSAGWLSLPEDEPQDEYGSHNGDDMLLTILRTEEKYFSPSDIIESISQEEIKKDNLKNTFKKYEDKVDKNYLNDTMWAMGASYRGLGLDGLKKILQDYKEKGVTFKKYQDSYELTDENGELVYHIDDLAGHMNEMINNPENIDEQDFLDTYNTLIRIFRVDGLLLKKG